MEQEGTRSPGPHTRRIVVGGDLVCLTCFTFPRRSSGGFIFTIPEEGSSQLKGNEERENQDKEEEVPTKDSGHDM